MANYPNYKPKYKSLSKKDKADAKYISKTTPANRQFHKVAGNVVSLTAPAAAVPKVVKGAKFVKEVAKEWKARTKFADRVADDGVGRPSWRNNVERTHDFIRHEIPNAVKRTVPKATQVTKDLAKKLKKLKKDDEAIPF